MKLIKTGFSFGLTIGPYGYDKDRPGMEGESGFLDAMQAAYFFYICNN